MTSSRGDPEAFWHKLLNNLPQFVEAERDKSGLDPWDKNPNYIWNPPRPDRNELHHGYHVYSQDGRGYSEA